MTSQRSQEPLRGKLKIGIDLDDVVFEFVRYLIKELEIKNNISLNYEDIHDYKFPNVVKEWKEGDEMKFIGDLFVEGMHEKMDLILGARESILELSKKYDIYFITSRVHQEGTLESLQKFFSEINFELIFSSNPYAQTKGKTKGEICSELDIDFMIEDSHEHAITCVEKGIRTFLFNRPWNINKENLSGIIRVNSWKEVSNFLGGNKK